MMEPVNRPQVQQNQFIQYATPILTFCYKGTIEAVKIVATTIFLHGLQKEFLKETAKYSRNFL